MSLTITINEAVPATLTVSVGTPGATGATGATGAGVAVGGTTGQVLQKLSATNYDTGWATPAADYITAVTAPLAVTSGNLSVNLSTYLPLAGGTMDANATVDLSDTVTGTVSEVGGYGFAVSSASNVNLKTNVLFDRVLVGNATGATTIKPTGVEFPDLTLQTTAGISAATAAATYQTLAGMSSYLTTSTAASTYYLQTNPSGFITSSALTPYLLSSTAASTYQTLAGMSSYLTTATAATTYAPIAAGLPTGGTVGQVLTKNSGTNFDASFATLIPGDRYLTTSTTSLTINNTNKTLTVGTGLSYTPTQNITISYDAAHHMHGEVLTYDSGTGVLTVDVNNHTGSGTYAAWVVNVGGVTPATSVAWGAITGTLGDQTDLATALNNKLEVSTAAATYYPLVGNPSGFLTSAPVTSVAGRTGAITLANTDISGLGTMSTATAADYSTTAVANGLYYPLAGNPSSFLVAADIAGKADLASPALTGNVTITTNSATAALTITQDGAGDILRLNDVSADTTFTFVDANGKVNTVASTTTSAGLNVAHGVAPTSPVNGDVWTTTSGLFTRVNSGNRQMATLSDNNAFTGQCTFSAAILSFGTSNGTATIGVATGATTTGLTKTVNIGTAGVAGSTTNITVGSTTGTSTTTLQGTTNGITAAVDTNSVALATTAFVVGQAGSATPLVNGTAAVGTSLRYARQDHVHASDTTKANLASPTFTGTPTLPTGTIAVTQSPGNNTTALATTAFVTAAVPAFATTAQVVAATSTTTALAPGNQGFLATNPRLQPLAFINSKSASGSGAGTTDTPQAFSRQNYLSTLAAGRSAFLFGVVGTANAGFGTSTAKADQVDFSKKVWIAGYAMMGYSGSPSYLGDADTMCRITLGGYSTNTTGDMTLKGIGLKKVGGVASTVSLTVHNGTTLTDVASSVTIADGAGIQWQIYSDGTGNVTLYINGTEAATTTAGPTTATASGQACYREQVEAVATPGVRGLMSCNGGWFYTE